MYAGLGAVGLILLVKKSILLPVSTLLIAGGATSAYENFGLAKSSNGQARVEGSMEAAAATTVAPVVEEVASIESAADTPESTYASVSRKVQELFANDEFGNFLKFWPAADRHGGSRDGDVHQ